MGQCGRARVLGVKLLFFQRLGLLTCAFFCIISLGCLAPRVSGVVYEIWIAGIAQKLLCVTHKIGLGLTRGSLVPRALLEVELTGGCYLVLRGFLHE